MLRNAFPNSLRYNLIPSKMPICLPLAAGGDFHARYANPPESLIDSTTPSLIAVPGGTASALATSGGIDQGPDFGNAPASTSSVSLPALTTRRYERPIRIGRCKPDTWSAISGARAPTCQTKPPARERARSRTRRWRWSSHIGCDATTRSIRTTGSCRM